MHGLKFDFSTNDLILNEQGSFDTATIDNQNVAIISISQVCVLTKPELGAQIGPRMVNRPQSSLPSILADAKRNAESDGAKDVTIRFTKDKQLIFTGTYED